MALRAPSQVTTAEAAQEAEEAVATTRGGRCARSLWWRSMSGWIAAAANVASKGGAEGEGGLPAELVQGLNSLMHRARRAAERQPPAHRGTDERDDERDGEETERRDGEHLVGGLQRDAVRAALAGSRARRDAVEKGVVREPDEDGDDRREGVEVADQELELRRAVGGVAWARCNRQAIRCGYAPPAP